MNRVIDYAHLSDKSPGLDIHLVRMSRLFVGTTSGFAYVASSLGIPMVMVNAISSVGLLWTKQTIFSLKPVFKLDGKMLSQKDVTSDDYRWAFPTFESMRAAGLIARDSTDDEILEAVRECLLISEENINHSEHLYLRAWRQSVKIDGFYGAAIPSKYFLEKYQDFFI
jgi:putative glycosyltransferase (TIGR04372 family)